MICRVIKVGEKANKLAGNKGGSLRKAGQGPPIASWYAPASPIRLQGLNERHQQDRNIGIVDIQHQAGKQTQDRPLRRGFALDGFVANTKGKALRQTRSGRAPRRD